MQFEMNLDASAKNFSPIRYSGVVVYSPSGRQMIVNCL
jgi:hypothetical protein